MKRKDEVFEHACGYDESPGESVITTHTLLETTTTKEKEVKKEESKRNGKERAVLVTTEYRGVFFGYATETDGDVIKLRSARNCIYWDNKTGGFLGLAEKGPGPGCRIGARADIELRKITCISEMTKEAVAAWEAQPCYAG